MGTGVALLRGNGARAAVSQGLVVSVLVTACNVLAGIVTARALGAHGRGELTALTTLPTFCSFVMTLGLPSALVYQARSAAAPAGSLHAAALLLALALGVIGALAGALATPHVLGGLDSALVPAALALNAFAIAGLLSNVGMAALQSRQEFTAYNAVRIAQPVLQLAVLALLAAGHALTPLSAALTMLAAGAPAILWNLRWMLLGIGAHWNGMRDSLRRLVSYAARAAGGELLLGLAGQLDKLIVVALVSSETVGLYVVALSLSRLVAIVSGAIVPVLFPVASGRSRAEVVELVSRAAAMTTLLAGAAAVLLLAAGPWLLARVYGAEFAAAGWAFRLLVLEAVLASVVHVLSQAFMALDRPGLCTLQYGFGAVVAGVLLAVLTPSYGIEGAASALLAAGAVRLATTYWCFARVLRVAPPRILGRLGESLAVLRAAAARGR